MTVLCPVRPEKRGRMSIYQKTVPTSDVFTAAMLPADYPSFDGSQACADVDENLFFPSLGNEQAAAQAARRICRDCAFQVECATWAIRHGELGFWGGTSERERNAIRRRAS